MSKQNNEDYLELAYSHYFKVYGYGQYSLDTLGRIQSSTMKREIKVTSYKQICLHEYKRTKKIKPLDIWDKDDTALTYRVRNYVKGTLQAIDQLMMLSITKEEYDYLKHMELEMELEMEQYKLKHLR
jgi:hypothetical protein